LEAAPYRLLGLVVAGGTGTRLGANMPKQMLPLRGKPILAHTLSVFLDFHPDLQLCTVLHASILPDWPQFLHQNFPKIAHSRLHACAGGPERTESVHLGLELLAGLAGKEPALVAIHDGVRPFIDRRMLAEGYALAWEKGNAVAGVPVKSSLRRLTDSGSKAIDRSQFFHVQTPQIFHLDEILKCYINRDSAAYTDDAGLAEAQGMNIHLYPGSYDNIKITTPEDLVMAERILDQQDQK
jgi:2-C-methyl-D-erythritol 4-phosphate cytidylyltransferase